MFDGGEAHHPDGRVTETFVEQVSALRCFGCRQVTVVVEEQWVGNERSVDGTFRSGGTINFRGIHWWPPPGVSDLDESIPPEIRGAFTEAVRCRSAGAPLGAATMLRRTLEAVVRDRGSATAVKKLDDERSLAGALTVMADEGSLDPTLSAWAKEVRLAGNVGGHFDPMEDVTNDEADDLNRLVRAILTYLYEMPAKLRRSRQGSANT